MESGRIKWVDVAKGIAIIFVVYYHTLPLGDGGNKASDIQRILLTWWHQPVFFLLCGFFINDELLRHPLTFIKRRIWKTYRLLLNIYIPALLLHNIFLSIGWYSTMTDYSGKSVAWWGLGDTLVSLLKAVAFAGREPIMGAMWFVYVLILALLAYSIISSLLWRLCGGTNVYELARCAILLTLCLASSALSTFWSINIPRFNITLTALWWIYCGHMFMGKWQVAFNSKGLLIASLMVYYLTSFSFGTGNWTIFSRDIVLTTISYVAALYIVCFLARRLAQSRTGSALAYCGRQSFYIMSLHLASFKVATAVLALFGINNDLSALRAPVSHNDWQLFYYWCMGVALPLVFIKFFFWGKSRIRDHFIAPRH